jgi:hypothetical protein
MIWDECEFGKFVVAYFGLCEFGEMEKLLERNPQIHEQI